MFSTSVIGTDDFLDLPATAKVLYFYLIGEADDDGFVDKVKGIMRLVGATSEDVKVLVAKKYVISFDSGVVVVAHWKMHNSVRKDMYKPTKYVTEKETLVIENEVYRPKNESVTSPLQIRNESVTSPLQGEGETANENVTLGKDRIGKDRIVANARARAREDSQTERESGDDLPQGWDKVRKKYEDNIHPVSSVFEMEKLQDDITRYGPDVVIRAIERAVMRNNRTLGYIEGILKRWEKEGYDDGQAGSRAGAAKQKALPPGYDAGCAALFEQACAEAVGSG